MRSGTPNRTGSASVHLDMSKLARRSLFLTWTLIFCIREQPTDASFWRKRKVFIVDDDANGFCCGCERCTRLLDDTRVFYCPRCAGVALAVSESLDGSAGQVDCTVCGSLTSLEGQVLLEAEARLRSWMPIRMGKQAACSWFSTSAAALEHIGQPDGCERPHSPRTIYRLLLGASFARST
eukprot:gnl/TRDRNA2_/TRDRNA2_173390_c0_seq8.p1 gnl/TRDRNA2_/TRDRNA2_173390_c0~~gnl/TRDRNA2_/TRDRNA2_173390_c0_seq8.p1  ORF type:complete len:180 (+),score=12.86 gnl/TRDRNA2_/TRDRNA2_173390_c0_seq8:361-900(+)